MNPYKYDPTQVDWEDVLLRLTAFAQFWAQGNPWFRGPETTSFLKGKEAYDYAMDAIEKHLRRPEKFDPERGDLVDYLKLNFIRSFIRNDVRKIENRTTEDIFAWDDDQDDDGVPYSEQVLPYVDALFPDDIDYAAVKAYIENEVAGDQDAESILLGIYTEGLKRREIIEKLQMTEEVYDNGVRRLNTAIRRAAKHFTEKGPTV